MMDRQNPPWPLWLVALLCAAPYLGFWLYGLTDLDEGFYGAVTVDMLRRGEWLIPTLNGEPWLEKPILSYWLSIPSVALFPNEFGARLPSFLCTLATAFVIYRFALRHFGPAPAALAALVYSSSLLVVAIGRMMMTDAPLVLCLTLAFTTFYDSIAPAPPQPSPEHPAPRPQEHRRLLSAIFVGLAILAKGPVGAVLFLAVVASAFWQLKPLRQNFKKWWTTGTLLLLATVSTWYLPAYLAKGDYFLQRFIVEQNIGRFAGGDKAHQVPFWAHPFFFPAVLALSFAPWVASAFRARWHGPESHQGQAPLNLLRKYLWIWALVPLLFFTASQTKLVHYILPSVPPLAILAAEAILARHPARKSPPFWFAIAAAWSVFVSLLANTIFITHWQDRFQAPQYFAKTAARLGEDLAVFRLGRQGQTPEITLQLQDTSHPSVLFYYPRPVLDTPDPQALAQKVADNKRPLLVIMRDNPEKIRELLGLKQQNVSAELVDERDQYLLYRLTPIP